MLKGKLWCRRQCHVRNAAGQYHRRGTTAFCNVSISILPKRACIDNPAAWVRAANPKSGARNQPGPTATVQSPLPLTPMLIRPTAFRLATNRAALQEQKSYFFFFNYYYFYEYTLEFTPLAKRTGMHLERDTDMVAILFLMCKPKDSASVFRNQT